MLAGAGLLKAQENTASPSPNAEHDLYFWGYYEFSLDISKKFNLNYKNILRLNENITRFDYTAFNLELEYRHAKWMKVYAAYRFNVKNHWRRGWESRHQIRGTVSLRHKFEKFKIYNRSRIQTGVEDAFGDEEVGNTDLFYRNRTRIKYYIDERWDVFAYFEGYFRLGVPEPDDNRIYRKRYGAGLNFQVNPREQYRLFFVTDQQVRRGRQSHRYFIGFGYTRNIEL